VSRKHVELAQEYLAFTLLNLFDLFLTGYIFRHHGMEANGVAVAVMERWGLQGFAIYKFLLVLVVVLACEGITTKSPRKAKFLIIGGCLVYVGIVLYESILIAINIHKFG